MQINFVLRPSPEDVEKRFPMNDLQTDDFLDWLTDSSYKENESAFFQKRKTVDDFYTNLFLDLFKPLAYKLTIRRKNNTNAFVYRFQADLNYSVDEIKNSLFDLDVLVEAEYEFDQIEIDTIGRRVAVRIATRR